MKKKYGAIDGLRTIACIGIVMMHMKTNNAYDISNPVMDRVINAFTDFVFLFMVISAFGMCCGYLEKILENRISMESFYAKRFCKVLPFFAFLVLVDVAMSHDVPALIEGFADVTLLFGLFPNNISVIGVAWFLGVIFAFYFIFPFYCVLIKTPRRAWAAFAAALALNYFGSSYFGLGRRNIVFCLCYLIAGGLIYHYRAALEEFSRRNRLLCLAAVAVSAVLYFVVPMKTAATLLVSATMLIYALGRDGGLLDNRVTAFISSVSMEIYLSHMVVFRVLEKLKLNRVLGNGWLQYVVTVVMTMVGACVFAVTVKACFRSVHKIWTKKIENVGLTT